MKVLLISSSFPELRCGVGDYVYHLAVALSEEGMDISVLTAKRPEIKLSHAFKVYPEVSSWDKNAITVIRKLIAENNFDAIHLHYHWWMYNDGILKGRAFSKLFSYLRKAGYQGKLIVTFVHDLMGPFLFPKAKLFRGIYLRKMLRFADQVIVHTDYAYSDIQQKTSEVKAKLHKVPCGSGIRPSKNNIKPANDRFTIGFFGFTYPQKGLEYLAQALALLKTEDIKPCLEIIGGEDIDHSISTTYARKVKDIIKENNLESQVRWYNYQDEESSSDLLKSADIAVLPFTEGMSDISSTLPTMLEHGLALVTTKASRTSSRLINDDNCILVAPQDADGLAKAIKKLYQSPELKNEIAQSGKDLYLREYSWKVIARKIKSIYER